LENGNIDGYLARDRGLSPYHITRHHKTLQYIKTFRKMDPSESGTRLFADKYNPKSLETLDYNFDLNRELLNLAKVKNLPHIMFCGIQGSGKKTRAMLFLRERFGPIVEKAKKRVVTFKYPNKTIEFQMLYSHYHFVIDPSVHGVYDRSIIQDMIKKIMQLQLGATDMSKGSHKVIIVENADRLTQEAQQSLRRTLERYVKNCRFVFLVNNEGNMIDPLLSRCLLLRVPAPTDDDISEILGHIIEQEGLNVSPASLNNLIKYSDRNLNALINKLQILSMKCPSQLANRQGIPMAEISDIHAHVKKLVDMIFTGTSLTCLTTLRGYIYDLLVNCVTPTDAIKLIYEETLTRIPDSGFRYKYEIIKAAKRYDHTVRMGSKPIYHLEALVVCLFNIIKKIQAKISGKKEKKAPVLTRVVPVAATSCPVTVTRSPVATRVPVPIAVRGQDHVQTKPTPQKTVRVMPAVTAVPPNVTGTPGTTSSVVGTRGGPPTKKVKIKVRAQRIF